LDIRRGVEFKGTFFKGNANFSTLNCGGSAVFDPATSEEEPKPTIFEKEANFGSATFGRILECQGATFTGNANFESINCEGSAFFKLARFKAEANFAFAKFGRRLECQGATFTGPVFLTEITVSQALQLAETSFRSDVVLYQSQIGILDVGDTLPFGEDSRLILRECRFDTFYGDPSVAREMAAKQPPEAFTRDPYLQLEKYYRGSGNDLEAKRMHYTGRNELRKNALRKGPRATNWGRFTRWGDWWIKWLTGYGVRTWLLLIYILVFLLVGTGVFWKADALLPVSAQEQGAPNGAQVGETHLLPTQPEKAREPGSFGRHLFERLVYSLDLFLPVVNLHVDENWQPNGLVRQIYAVVHSMVGWILVPLLLASLSGIIRRE
jgi:hypothetical protein